MTTTEATELGELEALLERVLPDPRGFAERVVQQVAGRMGAAVPADSSPTVGTTDEAAAHEALADRNVLLAAALGACECWGEDDGCPTCGGAGTAGWVLPDTALFSQYIAPAVARSAARPPAASARSQEASSVSADETINHATGDSS